MEPTWPQSWDILASSWAKLHPRWPQDGPRRLQDAPRCPKMPPSWVKVASRYPYVDSSCLKLASRRLQNDVKIDFFDVLACKTSIFKNNEKPYGFPLFLHLLELQFPPKIVKFHLLEGSGALLEDLGANLTQHRGILSSHGATCLSTEREARQNLAFQYYGF